MEFGYFTLSDNHYENNTRTANTFIQNITDEALYAEQIGMHSAWIGEHHFNSLGVLSCPDLVLSYIAARTNHIRLAPAVTVLPLHHPIRVAEQWATIDLLSNGRVDFAAGRGYDRREYEPFCVDFDDNQGIFEEGLELVSASRIRASTIRSGTCVSRRGRCRSRSRLTWRRSRSPRSNSRLDLAAG
jgi:alkanesulfonate monooxygenase SsuD/methylene tetrahydromethanopterin reductase-like flavin-dependent oxidoreductase (luciferase family)